jgi:hypothetical protein
VKEKGTTMISLFSRCNNLVPSSCYRWIRFFFGTTTVQFSHSSLMSVKRGVIRYHTAELGNITTINLLAFSGSFAICVIRIINFQPEKTCHQNAQSWRKEKCKHFLQHAMGSRGPKRLTWRVAANAAPEEMPTRRPCQEPHHWALSWYDQA